MDYYYYNDETGEIGMTGSYKEGDDFFDVEGQSLVLNQSVDSRIQFHDIVNDLHRYREAQSCVQDTSTITANTIDESIITLMGTGSECFIDNVSQGINPDNEWRVNFDTEGVYKLKIIKFPFLDKEFTVNAN